MNEMTDRADATPEGANTSEAAKVPRHADAVREQDTASGQEISGEPIPGHELPGQEIPGQEIPVEPNAVHGAAPSPESHAHFSSWLRDLVISVAVSVFIITFLYQPVKVEGTSMLPELQDQERLFIDKFSYRLGDIHRDDVVVFFYPRDTTKSYIKRIIALPGDDLRIYQGKVFVNREQIAEPYVPRVFGDDRSQPEMVIPPHEYWVMGDHRSISSDSRDFGPVDRKLIYGKATFVYWPVDKMGAVR